MYIILILLGALLCVVGLAQLLTQNALRKKMSRKMALVVICLGVGSCGLGGVIGPKDSDEPSSVVE